MWKIALVIGLVMSGQSTMMLSDPSYDTKAECERAEPALLRDIVVQAEVLYGDGNFIVASKCFLPGVNN